MIPYIVTLFEFISVPYENQHQTLNIKKIDRGQIRLRKYLFTHTCQTAGLPMGGGGGLPLSLLSRGDFVNSQFASCFHHIGRFMTIKRLIKPLIILNQTIIIFCDLPPSLVILRKSGDSPQNPET